MEIRELLTIDELSERLRVPKSWCYDKTRQKGPDAIPVIRVGKYCRFEIGAVMDWLQKKRRRKKSRMISREETNTVTTQSRFELINLTDLDDVRRRNPEDIFPEESNGRLGQN